MGDVAPTNDKISVKGGCHCGHIRYVALIKPEALAAGVRCNCTFCQKLCTNGPSLERKDFTLLSPRSIDETGDYQGPRKKGHRRFCQTCGVHVWIDVYLEMGDQIIDHFKINIRTIDQPQGDVELDKVKFRYLDGLHDNFDAGLKDTPWPGGLL